MPIIPIHFPSPGSIINLLPSNTMAARFAPLSLLSQLHDLPQIYSQRIRSFGAIEGDVATQHHLDRFSDFIHLEEGDHEDIIRRLFAQSFLGDVKKWFKSLAT